MSDKSGVNYTRVDDSYFEKRGLRRYAGVWSLWALGVGAVISGHFSGWNLGLSNGWGSMFIATIIIATMYLGLTFSLAEMSPALPHTGGAYSFARTAMGPWGGFLTGLSENVEYVLTPAVIVFFISSYMGSIFGTAGAGSLGGYQNTPQGKVLTAAFMDAYNNMVISIRNYKAQEVRGGLGQGGNLQVGN